MNKITFANYLKKYLLLVSNKKTLSISLLLSESKTNVRIVDPLILYCVFNNKTDVLDKHTNKYSNLYKQIKECDYNFNVFEKHDFSNIYNSYINEINRVNYDLQIKNKMRDNILRLQKEKKVSNYRIYIDLKLNPGNINSYLKNNDCSKLSLECAKKIVRYLLEYNY